MHVVFVHQNYPAQFGHIAQHLAERHGFRCTFVSQKPPGRDGKVFRIEYKLQGGATEKTHYCARTFENAICHTHAVYEALKGRPDIQPDLIVGHSGFGSTLFLRELYPKTPIINYFEYFYRTKNSDIDFRPEFATKELDLLRARARNATLLLDLHNCDAAYSPTAWQRSCFPPMLQDKIQVIFDGIDTTIWKPQAGLPRVVNKVAIPDGMKIVTYATRGMESMRGFDIFMKFAKKLGDRRKDVIFLIAGQDRVCYGGDEKHTGSKSFKEWVLKQDDYDLSRFVFLGLIPVVELAKLFALTDLHVYLTVPFVLSWSLLNALACGSTILASDTGPVQEVIHDGETGLRAGFFDVDGMVERAEAVLDDPAKFRHLGENGAQMVREKYSLDVCLPKMLDLYREVVATDKART